MIIYVVKSNDTLTKISESYGVRIENLAADNGINIDSPLVVGQALVVQIPEVIHTVKRGETLTSVASLYGTTAIQLLRNNYRLKGRDRLTTGEELIIRFDGESKSKTFAVNSYAYPYIESPLLREQMPYLTFFAPFTYGIGIDGGLVQPEDEELIRIAGEYGVSTLLHLSTLTEGGNFSSDRASLIFENNILRERLMDEMVSVINQKGFGGADVDFEFINPEERFDYIQFLQELRAILNPLGLPLFSALAPKTSDNQRGVLYEGHDYGGIGAATNFVLLMTYEWGYTFGPPYVIYSTTNYIGYLRLKMLVLRGVADFAALFCYIKKLPAYARSFGYLEQIAMRPSSG